jgi:uncharacterized protein (DUF58 family)
MSPVSQDLFRKIRKIQIHSTQLANDILAGAWHSAFKGRGMEFEEVREYQTGDEIRSIDWNVTARMNHPFVKVFREERELTVILIVDVSASSRFGSQNQLKRELIAEIGAVLAFSAIKNNDKVGLILFSEDIEKYIPPKKGIRHVLRVIRELLVFKPKGIGTNLQKALDFTGTVLRKSSICFLISDFICTLHQQELSILAKKHDFIAINVSDPYELEFPKVDLIHLVDLETGTGSIVDASDDNVQSSFKESSLKRIEAVEKMMRNIGADFMNIRTDLPYVVPMRKFFKGREIKH